MMSNTLLVALLVSFLYLSDAFTAQPRIFSSRQQALLMKSDRVNFKSVATAVILATGLSIGSPSSALAEGVFFERKTYSEVLNPKDAQFTEDAATNENVKAGKTAIKKYIASVTSLAADLKKDNQLDVKKRLAGELNPGFFHKTFNCCFICLF